MKSLKLLKEELLMKANNSRILSSNEQKLISGGDSDTQGCKDSGGGHGGPGGKWKTGKGRCYYVNGECECRDS